MSKHTPGLIAVDPEMVAELRECVRLLNELRQLDDWDAAPHDRIFERLESARSVYHKATGEWT